MVGCPARAGLPLRFAFDENAFVIEIFVVDEELVFLKGEGRNASIGGNTIRLPRTLEVGAGERPLSELNKCFIFAPDFFFCESEELTDEGDDTFKLLFIVRWWSKVVAEITK